MITNLNPLNYLSAFKQLNFETALSIELPELSTSEIYRKQRYLLGDIQGSVTLPSQESIRAFLEKVISPKALSIILSFFSRKDVYYSNIFLILTVLDSHYSIKHINISESTKQQINNLFFRLKPQLVPLPLYEKLNYIRQAFFSLDMGSKEALNIIFKDLQDKIKDSKDFNLRDLSNYSLSELTQMFIALVADKVCNNSLIMDTFIYIPILQNSNLKYPIYNFVFMITCLAFLTSNKDSLNRLNLKLANGLDASIPSTSLDSIQLFK